MARKLFFCVEDWSSDRNQLVRHNTEGKGCVSGRLDGFPNCVSINTEIFVNFVFPCVFCSILWYNCGVKD